MLNCPYFKWVPESLYHLFPNHSRTRIIWRDECSGHLPNAIKNKRWHMHYTHCLFDAQNYLRMRVGLSHHVIWWFHAADLLMIYFLFKKTFSLRKWIQVMQDICNTSASSTCVYIFMFRNSCYLIKQISCKLQPWKNNFMKDEII